MDTDGDSLPLQLRYSDFDDQGVLNNAVYLSLFELGRVHLLKGLLSDAFLGTRILVAHIEVDYLRPVTLRQTVDHDSFIPAKCRTGISSVGNTSLTFAQALYILNSEDPVARCRTIAVLIDDHGKKRQVPEEIRERLGRQE